MTEVTLITNDGDGMPQKYNVRDGATVEDLLNLGFDGCPDDFTIQRRSLGATSEEVDEWTTLRDGDRITLAPKKVEGAK